MYYYAAPEVLELDYKTRNVLHFNLRETRKSQVYSLGSVAYELATMMGPRDRDGEARPENPFRGAPEISGKKHFDFQTKTMIEKMMLPDPDERPSLECIL